jgi:hypothetical protein
MNAIDLTTKEALASELGLASNDARLPALVTRASQLVRSVVRYDVHRQAGRTEKPPGTGGALLFLAAGRVTAITSITINGVALATSEYLLESEFGRVRRLRATWPWTGTSTVGVCPEPLHLASDGSIIVTFDSGWVTPGQNALDAATYPTVDLPADLELAALQTATALHARRGKDLDVQSYSLGDASVTYRGAPQGLVPTQAAAILAPYTKPWTVMR